MEPRRKALADPAGGLPPICGPGLWRPVAEKKLFRAELRLYF